MSYEPCPGSGRPPAKNSGQYKRVGNWPLITSAECKVCGKRCKVTLYNLIVRHKSAK